MPVDNTDGAPDIGLELGSCRVCHIPEVDLIGQLGEGSQERLDGGIGTGGGKVLRFPMNHFFSPFRKGDVLER